jgi:hypothetical protein
MSNFTSAKYQAIIRTVNAELAKDDNVLTLRKRVMALHAKDNTLGGAETMSKACASTYFSNVTENLRVEKVPSAVVQVVGQKVVHSICTVDAYGTVLYAEYYEDDTWLDVNTSGKEITKGYQVVGQKVGIVYKTKPEVKVVQLDASMWVNA